MLSRLFALVCKLKPHASLLELEPYFAGQGYIFSCILVN